MTLDWERVSPPAEWKPFSLPERLYLKTVRYGGVGGQSAYDISFAYDALRFEELRIGFHPLSGRDWVSRRISTVTTTRGTTTMAQHRFRWSSESPFELQQIETRIGTDTQSIHTLTFEYHPRTESAPHPSKLSPLLTAPEIRQPFRLGVDFMSISDVDGDGSTDLEMWGPALSPTNSGLVRFLAKSGFVPTPIAPASGADPWCSQSLTAPVRLVIRPMWSPWPDDAYSLVHERVGANRLVFCAADGTARSYNWQPTLAPNAGLPIGVFWPDLSWVSLPLFLDADGDSRTDLVDIRAGVLRSYPNQSELRGAQLDQPFLLFSQPTAPVVHGLGDRIVPIDYNGDGLADLAGSGILINDGKVLIEAPASPLSTQHRRIAVDVELPPGVDGCETSYYDGDADGWAEPWLVCKLTNSDDYQLFRGVNRRAAGPTPLPGLPLHRYTATPVDAVRGKWIHLGSNFEGTAGFQVVWRSDVGLQTMSLADEFTGRLTAIVDHERNETVRIGYALPPPGNSLGIGAPVVAEVTRENGVGVFERATFSYDGPEYSRRQRRFLGFTTVEKWISSGAGAYSHATNRFSASQDLGMKLEYVELQESGSALSEYVQYYNQIRSYQGLSYWRRWQEAHGVITNGQAAEMKRTTWSHCRWVHDGDVTRACPADEVAPPRCEPSTFETTGAVTRQTLDFLFTSNAAPWPDALSCLVEEERALDWSSGSEPRLLMAHSTLRDSRGLVEKESVSSAIHGNQPLAFRDTRVRTYNGDGTLRSDTVVGRGTVLYKYSSPSEAPLWTHAQRPTGEIVSVEARDPVAEAPTHVQIRRGTHSFSQYSRFDTGGRLVASWNSLHGSERAPAMEFAYWTANSSTTFGSRKLAVTPGTPPGTVTISHPDATTTALTLSARDRVTSLSAAVVDGEWIDLESRRRYWDDAGAEFRRSRTVSSVPQTRIPSLADFEAQAATVERSITSPLGHLQETHVLPPQGGGLINRETRRLVAAEPVERLLTYEIARMDGQTWTQKVDADGNVHEVCADLGGCVATTYDALGRAASVTLPDGSTAQLVWSPDGGLGDIHWSFGLHVSQKADGLGRLEYLTISDDRGGVLSNEHITYDEIGRIKRREVSDVRSPQPWYADYSYNHGPGDQQGFLERVESTDAIIAYGWDGLGRLRSEEIRIAANLPEVFIRKYALRADDSIATEELNLTSNPGRAPAHAPSQMLLEYHYLRDGRVASIDSTGVHVGFDYAASDPRLPAIHVSSPTAPTLDCRISRQAPFPADTWSCVGADGASWSYRVEHENEQVRREHVNAAAGTMAHATGQLEHVHRSDGSQERYVYEADRTLLRIEDGNGGTLAQHTYFWGPNQSGDGRTFDELGRAASVDQSQLSYDGRGRLTRVSRGDQQARVIRDHDGIPIAETDGVQGQIGLVMSTGLRAFWRGEVCAGGEGTLWKSLSVGGVPLAAISSTGAVDMARKDVRGTSYASTTTTPFEPFGPRLRSALPAGCQASFAGMRATSVDALYLAGSREYDAHLGRFLQMDPLPLTAPHTCSNNPFACTRYGYAEGDPASKVDPSGLLARAHAIEGYGCPISDLTCTPFDFSTPDVMQQVDDYQSLRARILFDPKIRAAIKQAVGRALIVLLNPANTAKWRAALKKRGVPEDRFDRALEIATNQLLEGKIGIELNFPGYLDTWVPHTPDTTVEGAAWGTTLALDLRDVLYDTGFSNNLMHELMHHVMFRLDHPDYVQSAPASVVRHHEAIDASGLFSAPKTPSINLQWSGPATLEWH